MKIVNPKNTLETLSKNILVDGFHVVVDQNKSHDSWIYNAQNDSEYLDLYSQFASQALGWNHPALTSSLERLIPVLNHKIANSDMYTTQYAEFVETFSSITPDFSHYFFIDGGALAVENALKCAFDWKAQKLGLDYNYSGKVDMKIMHLKNAFHGRSGYTMSLTNTGPLKTGLFPKFDWPRIDTSLDGLHQAETYFENYASMNCTPKPCIAAIIAEPILGEGGDIHLTTKYLEGLRELADKYEALLIFDEVQTGLGLTGKWWAYQHHNVVPDIMCFGKKTQVCGIASTERVDEVSNNVFKTSGRINSTWGGNIVDMVRATIIIEAIRDNNYVDNALVMGDYLTKRLSEDVARNLSFHKMTNIRNKGLMIAFDVENSTMRDEFFNLFHSHQILALKCGEKGIRFRPHLTISKEDIDFLIDKLNEILW